MDVQIGHFEQGFLSNLDRKYLDELRDRLTSEYEDEPFARRHAIMHLLGFVHCELGEVMKGVAFFSKILQEDSTNLNALKNLIWAKKKLGLKKEAGEFAEKLSFVLQSDQAGNTNNVCKARALVEIARAACFTDQHHKQTDVEYAKKIFESGLALGACNPNTDELMDWKFGYAYHLLRIAKKLRNDDNTHDEQYFKEAVKQFYEVAVNSQSAVNQRQLYRQESVESVSSDFSAHAESPIVRNEQRMKDLRGKAWVFAGVLLIWHKHRYSRLSSVIQNCEAAHANLDGFGCLVKARDVAPGCGAVLRRIAQELSEANRFKQAKPIADDAVKAQPIGYAFYVRGQLNLKWYKRNLEFGQSPSEARDKLNAAIADLQEAIEKNFKPSYAIRDLAVAHNLAGHIEKALEYFAKADVATGGHCDHRMLEDWAKCLDDAGDHVGAEEKRKMASDFKMAPNIR